MILKAEAKVKELGYESALTRRFAVTEDLTINNVIFADRSTKPAMGVFDQLIEDAPVNNKNLDKVEEIGIEEFIKTIIPKADSIELLVSNMHASNFMSLIAPVDKESKNMLG